MDEIAFNISNLLLGSSWETVIDQKELLRNYAFLVRHHQMGAPEGTSFSSSNFGQTNAPIYLKASQGSAIDIENPVHILGGQSVFYNSEESNEGALQKWKELGEKRGLPKISLNWQAGAQMPPPVLTEAELLRLSRLAGCEDIQDVIEVTQQSSSQSIAEDSHVRGRQSEPDANYKAYLDEVERLSEECGECLVAYARGERIALAKNLPDLLANIPEEYDDDDILIQRIPAPSASIRSPIRVLG